MIRIAALYSHPIQYFVPVFRELASRPGVDFTAYFCTDQGLTEAFDPDFGRAFKWDIPLLDGYRSHFLPNWTGQHRTDGFWRLVNPSVVARLARERYDALLIHGYEHATKLMAMLAAPLAGTAVMLRGDSNLLYPRRRVTALAKEALLKPLLRSTTACLYVGRNNRDYYRHYGVPDEKLFFTPYGVDNAFWQAQRRACAGARDGFRSRFGIGGDVPVVLCSGKLVHTKQPLFLLNAFSRVRRNASCALIYAGDGPLRAQVEQAVRTAGIRDVHITGFLNQTEMAAAYSAADICVLPSVIESWGLAINEAMNFALPVVVTDRVGCAPDLVRPGENGFIVAHDRAEALADALERLVSDGSQRAVFGRRSLEMVSAWSVAACADGIITAAETVRRRRA
jgi:glycosyltransferase involved in cell wall biosynthesis